MARYLVDSDVLIWVLRNRHDTVALLSRLAEESGECLACSSLSILEILVGTVPSEIAKTSVLFDAMESLPVDAATARHAAKLLRAHRRESNPRDWVDALIAATALTHHLILVTYNRRDYPYPELPLYPL